MSNIEVNYDNALNEAGWVLIEELRKFGDVNGHQFNHIKPSLKLAIEKYLNSSPSHVATKPKPRTKTEFVQEESFKDVLKCAIDGEVFYSKDGGGQFKFDASRLLFVNHNGVDVDISHLTEHCFYRKVETEIDERQEFIDKLPMPDLEAWFWEIDSVDKKDEYRINTKLKLSKLMSQHYGNLFDSNKFKMEDC